MIIKQQYCSTHLLTIVQLVDSFFRFLVDFNYSFVKHGFDFEDFVKLLDRDSHLYSGCSISLIVSTRVSLEKKY